MAADFYEAARRIRVIGNWLILVGACFAMIAIIVNTLSATNHPSARVIGAMGLGDLVLAALPGFALRLLAWVVDGFGGPSASDEADA